MNINKTKTQQGRSMANGLLCGFVHFGGGSLFGPGTCVSLQNAYQTVKREV
jgi:hypothetical protein